MLAGSDCHLAAASVQCDYMPVIALARQPASGQREPAGAPTSGGDTKIKSHATNHAMIQCELTSFSRMYGPILSSC